MTGVELDTPGVRRAWGWVAALRDGATTPWPDWQGEADRGGGDLPGAQQLELLRRLNQASGRRPLPATLVDRVLTASPPGRGRTDLTLAGAGESPRFGPAPVEPTQLADAELLRLAAGLIAEDLAEVDDAALPPPRPPRRRPWSPSFRLAGDEWLVQPMRAELRRRARPEQHHPKHVYVVGTDLATMLGHAWTSRAFAESGAGWTTWLGGFVESDRLPRRADLAERARRWSDRIGREHVTLVLDPAQLPHELRLRRPLPGPPPVTTAGVDLVRRVSTTLGILRPAQRRTDILRAVLLPRLPDDPAAAVAVPARWHGWVRGRAEMMRERLSGEGYAVLGDPDRLTAIGPADGGDPAVAEVLGLALRLLLDPPHPVGTGSPRAAKEEP